MTQFIHKKYEVEQPDDQIVYQHKDKAKKDHFDFGNLNIYLIGLRGSGKSTLAARLAKEFQLPFLDLDVHIEKRLGMTIAGHVQKSGWQSFRTLESQTFREICQTRGQVVAPGGGIVLSEPNRELMKSTGVVFYLMAQIDLLVDRLQAEPKEEQRPELTSFKLKEEIAKTLQEREPLYLSSLDFVLQAFKPIDELVDDVKMALKSYLPRS